MRLWWLLAAVALVGCGPRKVPEPNTVYFWQITDSTLEWGACGDSPSLRSGVAPIEIAQNSYLVYRVDSTGKKATSQTCPALDPSTCQDSTSNIVFTIAGAELAYTSERKDPVSMSSCFVQQDETWLLEDHVTTMNLEIDTVLSLVDSPTDCPKLEASIKADSPNGLGVAGCVLSRKLKGRGR